MYRGFLDANLLFSAAYVEQSGLRRIWTLENVELVTSGYALEEARRNLDQAKHLAELQQLIASVTIVELRLEYPSLPRRPHGLPEKDQPILWAAIDCGATHLVTGDVHHFGHLLDAVVEGVQVVLPQGVHQALRGTFTSGGRTMTLAPAGHEAAGLAVGAR